jgi:hypothetical protein
MCGMVAKPARTAIALIWVGAGLNGDFALMCGMVAKPARTAIMLMSLIQAPPLGSNIGYTSFS